MNHRLLHHWAREEALPLPSRSHPQNQNLAVYTEELTDLLLLQLLLMCEEYPRRFVGDDRTTPPMARIARVSVDILFLMAGLLFIAPSSA